MMSQQGKVVSRISTATVLGFKYIFQIFYENGNRAIVSYCQPASKVIVDMYLLETDNVDCVTTMPWTFLLLSALQPLQYGVKKSEDQKIREYHSNTIIIGI